MTRKPQIELGVTVVARDGHHTIGVLIGGETTLANLHEAVLRAVHGQHPHLSSLPIFSVKYGVLANTGANSVGVVK